MMGPLVEEMLQNTTVAPGCLSSPAEVVVALQQRPELIETFVKSSAAPADASPETKEALQKLHDQLRDFLRDCQGTEHEDGTRTVRVDYHKIYRAHDALDDLRARFGLERS